MKRKKLTLIVLLILILLSLLFLLFFFYFKKGNSETMPPEQTQKTTNNDSGKKVANEKNYLLEGYPLETVPLYKMKMVSSSKFFVNDDPSNSAGYFGKPINYYNVVFETEENPKELLQYYRGLMSEVNEEGISEERIEGVIGKYKVSVSHYGNNPKNYAYLQVYLPSTEYQETNKYFRDYPNIISDTKVWTEHESSYGLLNQKGGEIEYTQYFLLPGKEEDQDKLINEYQENMRQKEGYSYDEKSGLMRWNEDGYSIALTFSKSHGRIYLMMRTPMK